MSRPIELLTSMRRNRDNPEHAKGPAYFNAHRAVLFGQYPKHFAKWACKQIQTRPHEVLHVCSGALAAGAGVRVDVRRCVDPDVCADGRRLPFRTDSFPGALLDPPYSKEYAKNLYATGYPTPASLLREAVRVVRPGGRIGFLHHQFPFPVDGAHHVSTTGITTGCGFAIRCFVIMEVDRQMELM